MHLLHLLSSGPSRPLCPSGHAVTDELGFLVWWEVPQAGFARRGRPRSEGRTRSTLLLPGAPNFLSLRSPKITCPPPPPLRKVSSCLQPAGVTLVSVHSSPNDQMLWALDSRWNVHVRAGITEEMPVGTDWEHVPGRNVSVAWLPPPLGTWSVRQPVLLRQVTTGV